MISSFWWSGARLWYWYSIIWSLCPHMLRSRLLQTDQNSWEIWVLPILPALRWEGGQSSQPAEVSDWYTDWKLLPPSSLGWALFWPLTPHIIQQLHLQHEEFYHRWKSERERERLSKLSPSCWCPRCHAEPPTNKTWPIPLEYLSPLSFCRINLKNLQKKVFRRKILLFPCCSNC